VKEKGEGGGRGAKEVFLRVGNNGEEERVRGGVLIGAV